MVPTMVQIAVQIIAPVRVTLDPALRRDRLGHRNLPKVVRGRILKVILETILEAILEAGRRRDMVAMVHVIRVKAMLAKITVMEGQGAIIVKDLPKVEAEVISPKETVSRCTLLLRPRE